MNTTSKARLLRTVPWRDLAPMTAREGAAECLHPLPWLAASLAAAHYGWFLAALPCTFLFFLTALRLNHEAIHHNLGFTPTGHRAVLHGLSALMLGSNHSVAWNHLRHHRHFGQPEDLEGKAGRMRFLQVLAYGPLFALETHHSAWKEGGPHQRRLMRFDLAGNAILPALAILFEVQALAYHVTVMLAAQCMTAFFAVWITHHGCDDPLLIARTQRSRLVNLVSYNMFFHLEHHLFPAVPVKRLGVLARRIDLQFPELMARAGRVIAHAA